MRLRCVGLFAFVVGSVLPSTVLADPCPTNLPNSIYGSGGSAITATLGAVATALAGLPESERVTIFFWDPGACTGYESFVALGTKPVYFKFWNAAGELTQCEPSGEEPLSFAHMGNTPALCPGNKPLPAGFGKFVAPVTTINLITHKDSDYDSISAEALYHVFGFGPGATGRAVAPWTAENGIFGRRTNSFVHQILAGTIGVPATGFKIPEANFLSTNPETVSAVYNWGESSNPDEPLGYVSGNAADKGEDDNQTKTLAFQDLGQECAYLPDSSRTRKDKLNARRGQYALWTPAWFYAKVDAQGQIADPKIKNLIGWFDGSAAALSGADVVKIVIQSGDIPLCAMQAIRPNGDLSAIASYAPPDPCNGYYEFVATGSTSYKACQDTSECNTAAGEKCRYNFCELY